MKIPVTVKEHEPPTDEQLRQRFLEHATEAARHARCGQHARCRTLALSVVDGILDAWLNRHPTDRA